MVDPLEEIRERNLKKADIINTSDAPSLQDINENDFDKNVDVTLLLQSRAIHDGDIKLY